MRLLSTLLATVLAGITLAPQIADACGGYVRVDPAPRMLVLSHHGGRSFVVLEQSIDPQSESKWQMAAPGTFDATRIMQLTPLETSAELTLVGPSGTRTVKASQQFAMRNNARIGHDQKRLALEVDLTARERFVLAIDGKVDAKWIALSYGYYGSPVKITGTDMQIVRETRDGHELLTVKQGGRDVGYTSGQALGVVEVKGRAFLVTQSKGFISTLELPKQSIAKA